jgi:peptide/nickel transport system ATP-binding protein
MNTGTTPVLECSNLKKHFSREQGIISQLLGNRREPIKAVDDVSLALHRNESIGIIGESGCGKTTLLMTLIGLHSPSDGELLLNGQATAEFDKYDWKEFRRRVQIIFQDPFNSLNPRMTVRKILFEPLNVHGIEGGEERLEEVLRQVELQPPEKYLDRRPEQLSGGEKQRVAIARALLLEPDVLLADEPVSMLDVSTQASILGLLESLREKTDISILYISHDISTVSYVCDTINVMYLGRIVESAATRELIDNPKHPYTQALMDAVPIPDPHADRERTQLEGVPLEPVDLGEGCRFKDRCPERMDICDIKPEFVDVSGESVNPEQIHKAACHLHYDHEEITNGD